jgi:hypothetical protein
MLSARSAISGARRGMTVGLAAKVVLLAAALGSAALALVPPSWGLAPPLDARLAMAIVAGLWIALSLRSWQSTRLTAGVPHLLASGEFDEAERQIDRSLRAFSLFGPVKLVALHQLAVLRMAQGQFADAGALCREVLAHRMGRFGGLSRSSRMMLAQAALEQGEAGEAAGPLASLRGERLSLAESMNLVQIELDYQTRSGQWHAALAGFMGKVQLAEVMPSASAARIQALLGLSAARSGRADVARWLRRRAELLSDPADLVRQRPALAALWPGEADPANRGPPGGSE